MFDGLPLTLLSDWGVGGVVFLLVVFGWLVPKRTFTALMAERDYLRADNETLRETNAVQARTIEKQLVVADTVQKVMTAVQEAREIGSNPAGGGPQ